MPKSKSGDADGHIINKLYKIGKNYYSILYNSDIHIIWHLIGWNSNVVSNIETYQTNLISKITKRCSMLMF